MKKLTILLATVVLVSSVSGCGCCRRFRDLFNRGAYCGPTAAVATPTYIAPAPAPVIVPQPVAAPVVIPQQAQCAPVCCPCEPCCDPCCQPAAPCCETYGYGSTPMDFATGVPTYDSGWNSDCGCSGGATLPGTIGTVPTGGIDPGPVPPGP